MALCPQWVGSGHCCRNLATTALIRLPARRCAARSPRGGGTSRACPNKNLPHPGINRASRRSSLRLSDERARECLMTIRGTIAGAFSSAWHGRGPGPCSRSTAASRCSIRLDGALAAPVRQSAVQPVQLRPAERQPYRLQQAAQCRRARHLPRSDRQGAGAARPARLHHPHRRRHRICRATRNSTTPSRC